MIAQSVADIVADHVKLSVEGIDRMYLNVYVPRLQTEQGIPASSRTHREPAEAPTGKIRRRQLRDQEYAVAAKSTARGE
jgi:hypothetical protein